MTELTEALNDLDATGECCCAGCIGMGPCDLGEECDYGCGARVTERGDVCDRCEAEATGRCRGCGEAVGDDEEWCDACDDDATDERYADGDYDW